MYSVSQRTKSYKQPYGGYLPIKNFEVIQLESENDLLEGETLNPSIIGMAVDYLTRIMSGTQVNEAFKISLIGAERIDDSNKATRLAEKIVGLDDKSIINACKLVGYDCIVRAGSQTYKNVDEINPNSTDIHNIKLMVERSLLFFF